MKQIYLLLILQFLYLPSIIAQNSSVFYVVGNVEKTQFTDQIFQELQKKVESENASLIFLGNYSGKIDYNLETDELNYQTHIPEFFLDFIANKEVQTYFLPGNHEWDNGRQTGQDVVNEIEKVFKKRFKKHVKYIPDDAQPGPIVEELNDNTVLIFVNTQFWLQQNIDVTRINHDFDDAVSIRDLQRNAYVYFSDLLKKYQDKNVLLFGHHPAVNEGFHGGNFNFKNNFFPLAGNSGFYLPLPGFLYYTPRKMLGGVQDINHPQYKEMSYGLKNMLSVYKNVLYVSGHEKNFQLNQMGMSNQVIAGAVAKPFKNNKVDVALPGFTRLKLNEGNIVEVDYFSLENNHLSSAYNKTINLKPSHFLAEKDNEENYSDSIVHTDISEQYLKGKFTRFLMGDNYRQVWATESTFPVFDIEKEKGGLKILKRGGGQQTQSYRLQNDNKKQYVLRSVDKNAEGALPAALRGTFAVDIIQDGISASHPYGAIVVPELAEAARIYHTNPKIFYVPDDPALGIYRQEMKNKLFLFEERPAKNRDDVASFGFSKKVVSTPDVLEAIVEDDEAVIDQKFVLRNRLFDMWIADWDRHDDQWRWASFKKDGKTIYRPIPRDRDNAFFNSDGAIYKIVELSWVQPKFQGFEPATKNIEGFNFNGRYFDRTFLNELTKEDWISVAKDLQERLTDDVIDNTVNTSLPKEINELSGGRIKDVLKSRRAHLVDFANDYHLFLNNGVDIVGTEDEDLFQIKRFNDSTRIDVFSWSPKKEKVKNHLYGRTFVNNETGEIRLYGLGDGDQFKLEGNANKGLKLRLVGGKGKDKYVDNSNVKSGGKKTLIYDRFGKSEITRGKETALRLRESKDVYAYNRKLFKYNTTMPLVAFGYNVDDGVLLGGGFLNSRYHFRDSTMHQFTGKTSFLTGAFQANYKMFTTSFWRNFDLFMDVNISMPFTTDNFFGYGNNTENLLEDKKDYRIRYKVLDINPSIAWIHNKEALLKTGVRFLHTDLEETKDHKLFETIQNNPTPAVPGDLFDRRQYVSANASLDYKKLDNKLYPTRGYTISAEAGHFFGVNDFEDFTQIKGHIATYLSFRKDPRMVLALQAGGQKNFGDFPLFEAARLGQKTNLRGYRASRFAGESSVYQNTDLRLRVTSVRSYIFNGSLGLLAFHDVGRVWFDGDDSDSWHQGYGGGIWFAPFYFTNLSLQYEHSKEEDLITLNFNFLF